MDVTTGSLLEAWQSGSPNQKTAIVSELCQTLLGISREEAQSLPNKDVPSTSFYEKMFSLAHHHKRRFEQMSSRGSVGSN